MSFEFKRFYIIYYYDLVRLSFCVQYFFTSYIVGIHFRAFTLFAAPINYLNELLS